MSATDELHKYCSVCYHEKGGCDCEQLSHAAGPVAEDAREFDDVDDDPDSYCETCGNMGVVNCFCGGDLCCCENNGEMPCPECGNG